MTNPNCKVCGRELRVSFSEDFAGSNEGTHCYVCDYCDGREEVLRDVKELVGNMVLAIEALTAFKYLCYNQVDRGIDMDWLMANSPCNINSTRFLSEVLRKYFPEIYQETGKSIKQMEEELQEKLKSGDKT